MPPRSNSRKRKSPSKCAPKVPHNRCVSSELLPHCSWVYGKREYCRKRTNKRRTK